jgi:hypothetical protein
MFFYELLVTAIVLRKFVVNSFNSAAQYLCFILVVFIRFTFVSRLFAHTILFNK